MKRHIILLFLLSLFVFTVGCASTSSINTSMAPTVSLDNFKTLSIKVKSNVDDCDKEIKTFKDMLIAKLKEKGKWEVLESNPQLELSATFTNINKVGGASRIMFGALAGQASLNVDVALKDTSKDNTVSQFSVTGKSSGGTIFAGGTDQAIEKTVDQIIAYLDSPQK